MNRLLSLIALGLVSISAVACIASTDGDADQDQENVAESEAAQKAQTDRTGTSCEIFQCNGLLNPYGKCSDATCSVCVAGTHSAPGDGASEYCGPTKTAFIPGGSSSSSGGGVFAP